MQSSILMPGFDDEFPEYKFKNEAAYKAFVYGLTREAYNDSSIVFEANDATQTVTIFSDPGILIYGRYILPDFYEYCVEKYKSKPFKKLAEFFSKILSVKVVAIVLTLALVFFGIRIVSTTFQSMSFTEKISTIASPVDTLSEKLTENVTDSVASFIPKQEEQVVKEEESNSDELKKKIANIIGLTLMGFSVLIASGVGISQRHTIMPLINETIEELWQSRN
jgi:hypothetical protein